MATNIKCFIVKFLYGGIQNFYPAFNAGACASVNKGMPAIKNQIANMYNICFCKMNERIAIGMACSIIVQSNFFVTNIFAILFFKGLSRIILLFFFVILFGYQLLACQRIFMG